MSNYIVGFDIGTANTKVAVAENRHGRPVLRAVFKEPSAGLRKGAVIDLAEVSPAVSRTLSEVKKNFRSASKNVYINIGTPQIKVQSSRGILPISRADSEIYQDDIERVVKSSQAVNLAPNRLIIHNVTREFIVDGVGDILDPLGLSGNRLEVSSLIIDAFAPHVKSLIKAVELAGARIGGLVLNALVASRSALSKNQKNLGAALIDLGFGTTSLSVFEENKLVGTAVIPLGAGNITNDLAVGLRIPVAAAENLKLNYGYAVAREVNPKESIDLKKFAPGERGSASRRFIAEIIESRLAEIFDFVNNELKSMAKAGRLAGGAVLVGGGAKLPGLTELTKQELKLSTQIGLTLREEWLNEAGEFDEIFEDPEFVNALGLVLWGLDRDKRSSRTGSFFKIKDWLHYFMP